MDTIRKESFHLVGLKLDKKTTNQGGQSGIDCGSLWHKFEDGNYAARIPGKIGSEVYAVYFEYDGDHSQPFSYFIGCRVNPQTETPEGMDRLSIPTASYHRLIAKGPMPDCLVKAWKNIWNTNHNRAYDYDFEVYDERSRDWSHAEVEIFLSVNN